LHVMKGYGGGEGIVPRIDYISTLWRWVGSFTPQPLYLHGKRLCFLLRRELVRFDRWSVVFGKQNIASAKNLYAVENKWTYSRIKCQTLTKLKRSAHG
jgi:hypothetical protein